MTRIFTLTAVLSLFCAFDASAQFPDLTQRLQQGADAEFKKMDKNNNGKVTKQEYSTFLKNEGVDDATISKSMAAFSQIDLDGDQNISKEEYEEFMNFATSAINDFIAKSGQMKMPQ